MRLAALDAATPEFQAIHEEKKLAEQGDAEAQYALGWRYFHGQYPFIKPALQRAKTLFQAASDHGHIRALVALGCCYAREGNHSEAKKCFQKAAETGNNGGRFCLATLSPDCEAIPLYYSAASEGHPLAQTVLGDRLANGNGVDQDMVEAAKWYKRAAEQGDAEAQRKFGDCYAKGWVTAEHYRGKTQSDRDRQAAKWYRRAAEQGDAEAQAKIADCYASGIGIAQNESEAARWYRKCGDLYAEIGEKRKAAKAYRKAGIHWRSSQIRDLGPKNTW